jgi:hypothetical protein
VVSWRCFIKSYPVLVNWALVFFSIGTTLILLEYSFRFFLFYAKPAVYDEIKGCHAIAQVDDSLHRFTSHPYLSYTRTDTVYDEDGMRIGTQFYPFKKPDNVIRIACMGGSTTMNKYPLFIKDYVERNDDGLTYEVMDFGCDGWTTFENLMNYMLRIRDFSPDIVFYHFGANDGPPMLWPDYRVDNSHYRIAWQDQSGWLFRFFSKYSYLASGIMLYKGVYQFNLFNFVIQKTEPTVCNREPETDYLRVYRRNLETLYSLIQQDGATLIVAPVPYHPALEHVHIGLMDILNEDTRAFCRENAIPLIETQQVLNEHPDFFIDIVHLYPPGIMLKSCLFAAMIRDVVRGYSEVIEPGGDTVRREWFLHHDSHLKKRREISLQWNFNETDLVDVHIYFSPDYGENYHYLGNTRDGSATSFVWKPGGEGIEPKYLDGPRLELPYNFFVAGIQEQEPFPHLNLNSPREDFRVLERIVIER